LNGQLVLKIKIFNILCDQQKITCMKKVATYLFGALFLFVVVTGGLIQKMEVIPDNAQIKVFPSQRTWLPSSKQVHDDFSRLLDEPKYAEQTALMMMDSKPTQYGEVLSGAYKGFKIHTGWGAEDSYKIGENQSLLSSWVFGSKKRWNKDGTWNY